MNLQKSRNLSFWYDAITGLLFVVAILCAQRSWGAGGGWRVLSVLLGIGCCLILHGVFVAPRRLRVHRYREALVSEPKTWLRCILLSDLHAGGSRTREWYERIVTEVRSLDPDIVLLGGDYVVDEADPMDALESLSTISARLGRYFVLGNHDFLDAPTIIRQRLIAWGFTDLTNRSLTLTKEGRILQLTGQDDHWFGSPLLPPFRGSPQMPHVTLAHEPDAALDFGKGDTDLLLAGHTHGGQIRLPFVGPLVGVPTILGRAADRGRRVINGVPLIISQGLGETDLRARLGCLPEIVLVEAGI